MIMCCRSCAESSLSHPCSFSMPPLGNHSLPLSLSLTRPAQANDTNTTRATTKGINVHQTTSCPCRLPPPCISATDARMIYSPLIPPLSVAKVSDSKAQHPAPPTPSPPLPFTLPSHTYHGLEGTLDGRRAALQVLEPNVVVSAEGTQGKQKLEAKHLHVGEVHQQPAIHGVAGNPAGQHEDGEGLHQEEAVQGDDGEDGVGDDTLGSGRVLLSQLGGVVQSTRW